MVQSIVNLNEYGEELLGPELRPEFIKELKKIDKEKHFEFKDIGGLRRQIGV